MRERTAKKRKVRRPLRGSPESTQERLLSAAAELFNRHGYHGTDSNRIAAHAGYATGTFYKHFKDKRSVFLAVCQKRSAEQWSAIQAEIAQPRPPQQIARSLVDISIKFHTQWRGLRASLLEMTSTDAGVRRFCLEQRRNEIDLIAAIREAHGWRPHPREQDAVLLFSCERTYDAIAGGELEALGLDSQAVVEAMVRRIVEALT